eukprot:TRINITY_DN93766_c0_g1_i1.p1 TRINITY_DN93766_c0_g1~~TRINITY_DN93766_c0_g1_i1.p1  ORF type:complete len:520 (-),score=97.74 TRINITY_DN93766_c0_g1_i1:219-1778(-)
MATTIKKNEAISDVPPEVMKMSGSPVQLSDVVESMGLESHHWNLIYVVCWCWALTGWMGTSIVYLLDGASEADSDWVKHRTPQDRLTVEDRSWALLVCSALALGGNWLLGYCSDRYGRMTTTTFCVLPIPVVTLCVAIAWNKYALFGFFFLTPWIKDGPCTITNCLLAEWLPITYRGTFLVIVHIIWNVGRVGVTVLWILVPPEAHWFAFCACVATFPAALSAFLALRGQNYESARWLLLNGQKERCIECLKLAAKDCKETLPDGWDDPQRLTNTNANSEATEELSISDQISKLVGPSVRLDLAALTIWFFALAYTSNGMFFWLVEYLKQTGREEASHTAMLVAPLGKITSAVILVVGGPGVCMVDIWDRKPLITSAFFGFALSLGVLSVTTGVAEISLAVYASQVCEEVLWCVMFLYATEAFPTALRSSAFGTVLAGAGLGGIMSAAGTGELMKIDKELPMYTMVLLLALAGASSFFVEENGRGRTTLSDRFDQSDYGSTANAPSSSPSPPPVTICPQ